MGSLKTNPKRQQKKTGLKYVSEAYPTDISLFFVAPPFSSSIRITSVDPAPPTASRPNLSLR